MKGRTALWWLWLALAPGAWAEGAPREFDWGFVASRQVDVNGDVRLRALGPVYEKTHAADGKVLSAVRPLHAVVRDPVAHTKYRDMVWPIATAKSVQNTASWRCLLAYAFNDDRTNPYSRRRFWLLPLWFEGREDDGSRYAALFPVGGSIHDIFFLDTTAFILWPLYVRSTNDDLVSNTVLWPLISKTTGDDVTRRRVFPLYGNSTEEGRHSRSFVMWPFWSYARSLNPDFDGKAWILWPLTGHMVVPNQRSWMFLPPFFRWTRGERQDVVHAWPFFQRRKGEHQKTYIWPFWGTKRTAATKSTFVFWPFIKYDTIDRGSVIVHRRRYAPFVYRDKVTPVEGMPGAEEEVPASRFKLWPLYSVEKKGDAYRYRTLELWPLRKNPRPVERSWAAWWTLWSKTGDGEDFDTELLWGLYRNRRRADAYRETSLFPVVSWGRDEREGIDREWTLLKGLLGYRREGTQRSVRLLYFVTLGSKGATP